MLSRILLILGLLAPMSLAVAACPATPSELVGRDLPARLADADELVGNSVCSAAETNALKRAAAAEAWNEWHRELAPELSSPLELLTSLEPIHRAGLVWQASAAYGDIASGRLREMAAEDPDRAIMARNVSDAYQQALTLMADEQLTPTAPAQQRILEVKRKADLARLRVSDYAPLPKNRAGQTAGSMVGSIRGVEFKAWPLPLQFEFDGVVLTADGERYFDEMVDFIRREGMTRIRLVGHTDAVGDEGYNQGLSRRRAHAIRNRLMAKNISDLVVTAEGRGETEPVAEAWLPIEEQHAQNRRVELLSGQD